jgi:uncharacterized protein YjbI with pentapeptide repeats
VTYLGVFIAVLAAVTVAAYLRHWTWTGLVAAPDGEKPSHKTLWDWMQLLIVPAVLAAGAYGITSAQTRHEQQREAQRSAQQDRIAADDRRDAALAAYLEQMSGLIAEHRLAHTSDPSLGGLAASLTSTVLRQLDGPRRGLVVQFLARSRLIDRDAAIVSLYRANLRGARLRDAYLTNVTLAGDMTSADLRNAILTGADLSLLNLQGADLHGAVLSDADFSRSNLRDVDFSDTGYVTHDGTDFSGACLTGAQFDGADLPSASFKDAEGRDIDFSDASFEDADFSGAMLMNIASRGTAYGDGTSGTFPKGWGTHGLPTRPYGPLGPCSERVASAP